MAQGADLKELACLAFDTFCGIQDHYGGICRHQRAVGILRKIFMAWRVQDIDAVAAVVKLHHRRSDGNSSLLFNIHPIGNGVALRLFPFN